tara:strand:+ start:2733 stop:3482 length:750 start_codon:yes stop_codon:yes gene_type:complete
MKHKVKVVRLPTKDFTDIIIPTKGVGKGVLHLKEYYGNAMLDMGDEYHHLHATVSQDREPIKEGDWFIWHDSGEPKLFKCIGLTEDTHLKVQNSLNNTTLGTYLKDPNESEYGDWAKCYSRKIIATTDSKLLLDMNQTIDIAKLQQSFLKEFVANPDGEWEVEYDGMVKAFESFTGIQEYRLKLNQDNTLTPIALKEKMYSREDINSTFHYGHAIGMNTVLATQSQNSDDPTDLPDVEALKINWIENNL